MPKNVIRIDEGMRREHLDRAVRSTVEGTLNAVLDAEAGATLRQALRTRP